MRKLSIIFSVANSNNPETPRHRHVLVRFSDSPDSISAGSLLSLQTSPDCAVSVNFTGSEK